MTGMLVLAAAGFLTGTARRADPGPRVVAVVVNDQQLAQAVNIGAEDVEVRGYQRAGVFRQAARRLMELATEVDRLRAVLHADTAPAGVRCPQCSGPVLQPARGRPRIYCGDACKRAARNARNSQMVS